ncbi:hypothetical protein DCAR_0729474 [Daucus carota subsp. sativus]|uniref:Uncharacterized protein n=1 Tax=Daucus carota subsp. sativus TaxID=79200 RepID=A0AAF1B9T0_DAUCS|nr:hypothetical protein DCAR_0729474 [Daucus carota subsp. sativus]
MASQPRIKSSLVSVIRMAKMSISRSMHGPPKYHQYVHNQDRPDKAYTTEWAKKSGMANAANGWIHVTTPPDYFGPILPERKMGVLCRQWAFIIHMYKELLINPNYGAQSVVISGGYKDDEDHGEWYFHNYFEKMIKL